MASFSHLPAEDRWALAFYVGRFAFTDAEAAEGKRLWDGDPAVRAAFPDLAALTQTTPADLAASAAETAARGEHDLAAQLYLLAADARTDEWAEWITCCLENAVIGKETRVLHRAVQGAARLTDPGHRVRADLALVELGDVSPDEVLVTALQAAREHPDLQARVLLQRARLLLGTHGLRTALELARRSVELAERAGRPDIEVDALTVAASVTRTLGEGGSRELIDSAAALAGTTAAATGTRAAAAGTARPAAGPVPALRQRRLHLEVLVGFDEGVEDVLEYFEGEVGTGLLRVELVGFTGDGGLDGVDGVRRPATACGQHGRAQQGGSGDTGDAKEPAAIENVGSARRKLLAHR